jgi:hypothetical protein
MILNARTNSFIYLFHPEFFDLDLKNKYQQSYISNMMLPFDTMGEFISSTIQQIDFPEWNMDTTMQTRMYGRRQEFKSAKPVDDLFKREFTLTFQVSDGFINYFIMLENSLKFLDFQNTKEYVHDSKLGLMNNQGYLMASIDFKKTLMIGMTGFKMSYADGIQKFSTFDVKFKYNDFELNLEFDKDPI